jgi:signal transduction histidine kinase
MTPKRLIAIGGLFALGLVGLPAFIHHAGPPPFDWRWVAAFATYAAAFALDLWRPRLALLVVESVAAVALVLWRCNGYEGALLAVIAMQLGGRLERRGGLLWVGAQSALLVIATSVQVGRAAALLLAPPYLGVQVLALFIFDFMQMAAAANAELRAMQQLLAESSRMSERLRMAHELHDALGHRLTALTLNLEVALQLTEGTARTHVDSAQSTARQLLAEVREIVSGSARDTVHVAQALQALSASVPRPKVHVEVAEGLHISDPERAHILLRCAQEIVTNAARHSAAENLWIAVRRDGSAVRMVARDDGRGSTAASGFGLRGMRERVESAGGGLQIDSRPGRGFDVTAWLPLSAP